MKNALTVTIFTVLITLFYRHVGQLVPQKEVPAPETVEVGDELTTEQMVPIGKKIVDAKCMSCHAVQPRFPTLDGVGGVAGSRRDGMDDVEYLAEALYEPNAFIVDGFSSGMTPANKPPLSLTDKEILTVIAYLQSLGGTPTVTMATKLKYQSEEGSAPKAEAAPADSGGEKKELSAQELFAQYACVGCHIVDSPTNGAGPHLYDIGKRMTRAQIYQAIVEPDAEIAEGFPPGVMGGTLVGMGFYKKVSSGELKALVDFLAEKKGDG